MSRSDNRHRFWPVTGRRARLALASAIPLLALSACSAGYPNLPTLGGQRVEAADALVIAADDYYNCMTEAGFKMQYSKNNEGKQTVVDFSWDNYDAIMWTTPNGMGGAGGDIQDDVMNDFWNQGMDSYRLWIDGRDYSADFARCHEESGYDESKAWGDNGGGMVDPAWQQLTIDASNRWAACARENGWPTVKDAVMPADPNSGYPTAVLPATITEPQLRQLLAVCPSFDPAIEEANNEIWQSYDGGLLGGGGIPDGIRSQPSIGFDAPGWNGDYSSTAPELSEAEMERLSKLQEILYEAQTAYYMDEKNGQVISVGTSDVAVVPE